MAEKNPINYDIQNSESSESLSPDEWTMIDENCCEKDDNEEDAKNDDAVNNDGQEISRSIEELQVPVDDAIKANTENVIIEKQEEDSDGISVITESDAEQLVERKALEEMETCQNHCLCTTLNKYEKLGEKSAPQVGTILNVVIACSLAAIIGLGAGRILGMDDKCPVTDSIDFPTIKIESDLLIDQIRELGEVKNVLDEIEASMPQMKEAPEKKISHQGSKSRSKRAEKRQKSSKISDTYSFDPDNTIVAQLQTSLNTLSSVIDEIKPESDIVSSETSRAQEIIVDLIKFKEIIEAVIKELEHTGESKELEFFRNAEKKIREICKSLLEDLTRTINGLTSKLHKKLNKVRQKLNKRLCLLKISESINREMFKPLEENNSFLESCDKVLNAASEYQAMKMNKKKKYKKKIHPKKKSLNDTSVIKSAESDDGYSRYSSSDSSMPDLTYNRDNDNDLWKDKRNSWRKNKNAKYESRKSTFGVNKKMVNPTNSNGASQNWQNIITDVTEAEESSPATEEPRFKLQTPNKKPLYSSVVKSVGKNTESKHSNFEKQKPDRKKFGVEESLEGKQILTETKHNVTPAESDVDVLQKVKKTKKQSNANVPEPVVKNYDDPQVKKNQQHKEIMSEIRKGPKQAENTEKIAVSEAPPKCYLKNKKCLNHSDASSESNKRQEKSTPNYVDKGDRVAAEKYKNMPTDHDDKKSKKEKSERKKSSQKMTATKTERGSKNRNDKQKMNDQLGGNWQLQRSRAREIHRDHDHRSEWFFDRADYRQDARKIVNAAQYCWKGKCQPILEEGIHDEKVSDEWLEIGEIKARKHHSGGRAGFTAKKPIKMPHRKNIFQSKHY